MNYGRALLIAGSVFIACFLALKLWFDLQTAAAAIAAGVSAVVSFGGVVLGLVKTTLEIKKLQLENRKLQREQNESDNVLHRPTLDETDRYGLKTQTFVAEAHEKRMRDK